MASPKTRSKAEAEGRSTRSHQTRPTAHKAIQELPNTRRKRQREPIEITHDAILSKRPRIDINSVARPKAQLKSRSHIVIDAPEKPRNISEQQRDRQPTSKTTTKNVNGTKNEAQTPNTEAATRLSTKHAEKVVAGIKHELDRLQPAAADTKAKDEKRKLRSQEGTRFKSELALYFPDYDVVIGNEPEEIHLLNIDTLIVIVDSQPPVQKAASPGRIRIPKSASRLPPKAYPSSLFEDLYDAQRVDFSNLEQELHVETREDPLPPSYYDIAHKKAERVEKNIRNTEKGRAQHEKDQVIRLLEGLQGHDWLKIIGVSGVTESKKKDFIPARDHFIKGCQFIVEKFRLWKEEEKRRKDERERLKVEAEEQDEIEGDGNESDGDPPDYSDVDHAAARQLHEEAMSRIAAASSSSSATSKRRSTTASAEPPPLVIQKDFVSFFKKPHLREAALGQNRRSGRSVSAFGHPVPELPFRDFELPEELIDEETLLANARKRRRERRVSKGET